LIIDVRGDSGGGFAPATAFVNFDPHATGFASRPRYGGPIAPLTDERTVSAGEGWANWFEANRRARLFGSTTAGASCRKVEPDVAGGLYKVVVPVEPYKGFLKRIIEREGLPPDVPVRWSAADLGAGRDTVAETARHWLVDQPR
jgi:C-terminal processing protease CtpA/Prc